MLGKFTKAIQRTAIVATALTMISTASNAATCAISGTSYSATIASASSCFTGNDTNQIDQNFSMFSLTGWTLADKNDDDAVGSPITFDNAPINSTKSGRWSILDYAGYTNVTLILKAGNQFGAFLLDTDFLSGTWASSKDLSHASIYYQGDPTTPSPVPLPAGGLLLVSGLFGLAATRRRRAKR